MAVSETLLVHNRLTHTLKVAQIARRLAQKVIRDTQPQRVEEAGGIDPDVVEAAALAHDLGHPPFGHVAESELQVLLDEMHVVDGFEGNAQSFRIATKLAIRTLDDVSPALNLTRASLRAVLKYPWTRGDHRFAALKNKWAAYDSEEEDLSFAFAGATRRERSVEAHLMDWSDDIAYAVHDVQDYYRAGLIPLDRLRSNQGGEAGRFLKAAVDWLESKSFARAKCEEAFEILQQLMPYRPYEGSVEDRSSMHQFASGLISTFIARVELSTGGAVYEHEEHRYMLEVLKQLAWYYVINRPSLATLQRGERRVVRTLYQALAEWAQASLRDQREQRRLPLQFKELLSLVRNDPEAVRVKKHDEEQLIARATVDYISSLTESQAVKLYQRLIGGHVEGSALEVWLNV